jgi:large subunit ribosomal protein L20
MSRVKSGVVTHARHRKVIKAAKGYYAARSTNFRTATQAVDKANQSAPCGSSGSTPPCACSTPR